MKFVKMAGSGNDFILIDCRQGEPVSQPQALAARLCQRHFSVGADGVAFINAGDGKSADIAWDFYNADGSSAEMCGNAARCVILWAVDQGYSGSWIRIKTGSGIVEGRVCQGLVEVKMPIPHVLSEKITVEVPGMSVNTGVPHFVTEVDSLAEIDELQLLGRRIRESKEFAPQGTNVTFLRANSTESGDLVSYERGVEDLTLACGTGVVAAAVYLRNKANKNTDSYSVTLTAPGGELRVRFEQNGLQPLLVGDAKYIYQGELPQRSGK